METLAEIDVEWSELRLKDAKELQKLVHRIEAADGLPYRTSEAEIRELLSDSAKMISIGGRISGNLCCYAFVRLRETNLNHAMCQGGVDPLYRGKGIGKTLVAWLTDTARQALTEHASADSTKVVEFYVETGNLELEHHLTTLGYAWSRSFYDLRASLETPVSEIGLSSLYRIEPWEKHSEEAILDLENRISLEERNRIPQALSTWLSGRSNFRSDWSFVVVDCHTDRHCLVGFLMASAYQQDWEALGWNEGSIDQIGVLKEHGSEPIAESLIAATMRTQAAAGMKYTAISLSSTNASGALSVFKNLGFETVATAKLFSIEL